MENFDKVLKISSEGEAGGVSIAANGGLEACKTLKLLRNFINIQQRRALAYSHLKNGFAEYMASGSEAAYQKLCSEITVEFNDCSKQVLEMESLLLSPEYGREDLAQLLRSVQINEKQKLNLVLKISSSSEGEAGGVCIAANGGLEACKTLKLLRNFINIQQRRALAYSHLKNGFAEYMASGSEAAYQKLCSEITVEFNDCSKQVLEMESLLLSPEYGREDLAQLLRSVQINEKQKLNLTATIQVLKKVGRPSERLVSHENCKFRAPMQHECVHVHEITEDAGTEEAEADAEYDSSLKEAINGVQDAVTAINEHLEEIRYEIAAIEAEE